MTIDKEVLFKEVKRSYEISRFENALWTLLFVIPLLYCSVVLCQSVLWSVALGTFLGGALIFAKWKGQQFGKAVFPGMVIGFSAYLIPFLWMRISPMAESSVNLAVTVLSGVVASLALIAYAKARGNMNPTYVLTASTVVALTGCLSCLMLGNAAILGMSMSVLLTSILGLIVFGRKN